MVTDELGGGMLDAAVRALFGLSWGRARALIERGKIKVDDVLATSPTIKVRAGARVSLDLAARTPRVDDLPAGAVAHIDAHVVVVRKPAGVSSVPYDDSETGTLDERVRAYLARTTKAGAKDRPNLGVVHRLDKETTGLIVFTRTWLAKKSLSSEVSNSEIDDVYQAALASGAVGGKLLGAGGGGFLLLFASPDRHAALRAKFEGMIDVPFRFESGGSQIIFYDPETEYVDQERARAAGPKRIFRERLGSGS